jgi:hypothetical protein
MIKGMIKHGCGGRPAHVADRSAQQGVLGREMRLLLVEQCELNTPHG